MQVKKETSAPEFFRFHWRKRAVFFGRFSWTQRHQNTKEGDSKILHAFVVIFLLVHEWAVPVGVGFVIFLDMSGASE